jgi:hypothetical protein
LATEVAEAYCNAILRCEIADAELIVIKHAFGDGASCAGYMGRRMEGFEGLEQAVAAGTVAYDGAAARACVDDLRTSCSAAVRGLERDDSCYRAFSGTVTEGGDCHLYEECAGELACDFGDGTCPGTCTEGSGSAGEGFAGLRCGGSVCSEGQECFFTETDDEVDVEHCVGESIGPDAAEGEPCGLVSETDDEVTRRACRPGSWCTGSAYTIGVCQAPIAAGAACGGEEEVCAAGHVCMEGSCRALTVVRTRGAACNEEELRLCDPSLGLECVDGTCAVLADEPGAAGAPCVTGGECASGACDDVAGTCRDRYCDA